MSSANNGPGIVVFLTVYVKQIRAQTTFWSFAFSNKISCFMVSTLRVIFIIIITLTLTL
jgi:hypothetical protein